jgi:hypothetical protein
MSNFQINIKQTQSGDSVKQSLADLKTIKATGTDSTKAVGEGFENMGRKITASQNIAGGFSRALKGDLGGLIQMAQGLRGMFQSLGSAVAVVGAGIAGWKIGTVAREWLQLKLVASQVGDEFASLGTRAGKARAEIARLNAEKLDKLRKEISETVAKMQEMEDFRTGQEGRQERVFAAEHQKRLARIEATMPEGADRDRALAEEKARYNSGKADREMASATKSIEAARQQKDAIDSQIREAQASVSAARENEAAARSRMKDRPSEERIKQASDAMAKTRSAEKNLSELQKMRPAIAKKAEEAIAEGEASRWVASAEKETAGYTRTQAFSEASRREAEDAAKAEKDRKARELADLEAKAEAMSKGAVPEARRRVMIEGAQASEAEAAARPVRGRLGGPSVAQKRAAASERAEADEAEIALRDILIEFKKVTDGIVNLKDQMKNANRAIQ